MEKEKATLGIIQAVAVYPDTDAWEPFRRDLQTLAANLSEGHDIRKISAAVGALHLALENSSFKSESASGKSLAFLFRRRSSY